MRSFHHQPPRFRVCLVLEGTRRFAPGRVSTWIRQIARDMPDIEFFLHYCGDRSEHAIRPPDKLPGNVSLVTTSHLDEQPDPAQEQPGSGSHRQKTAFFDLVRTFLSNPDLAERLESLCRAAVTLRNRPGMFTRADLITSSEAWQLLMESHERHAPDSPLVRYHATACDLASVLWNLLQTATTIPEADVYHSIGSGPVALLGAIASRLHNAPLILSGQSASLEEHIEAIRSAHRHAPHPDLTSPFRGDLGISASLEIAFCELPTRLALHQASRVTAVSESDARVAIGLGAHPERLAVVPHGIDSTRFTSIAQDKLQDRPPADGRITVGFLGRIVPAKDVKTLLRAARLVLKSHPETRFLIAGPTEADPSYFADCLALADQLGISPSIEFPGRTTLDEFLVRSDIVAITSLSDDLPLVLLEASAAGLPVVASDVGACRQALINQLPDHPTLGAAGIITEIADPSGTAGAINQLIANHELRFEHGMNGLRRVQSAYRHEDGFAAYHRLYHPPAGSGDPPRAHAAR